MSRIFITGDTHGSYDMTKLSRRHFQEGKTLTEKGKSKALPLFCGIKLQTGQRGEDAAFWNKNGDARKKERDKPVGM